MKKITTLLALIMTLTACMTQKELQMQKQNELNMYVGGPEYKVIAKYGQPSYVYNIDSMTKSISYYTREYDDSQHKEYARNKRYVDDGFDLNKDDLLESQIKYAHSIIDPSVRENMFFKKCTINFIIQKGTVVDAGFKGDGCIK